MDCNKKTKINFEIYDARTFTLYFIRVGGMRRRERRGGIHYPSYKYDKKIRYQASLPSTRYMHKTRTASDEVTF
jgi:hypothetical protein